MFVLPFFADRSGRRSALWSAIGLIGGLVVGCCLFGIPGENGFSDIPEARSTAATGPADTSADPNLTITPVLLPKRDCEPESSDSEDEPADPVLTPPTLEVQSGKLAWELQIDALLASHLSNSAMARQLIGLLALMPLEAHSRLAQEAVDRLPDREYSVVVLPVLLNPDTDGAAGAVLYADLLERPDAITLPTLLAVAQNSRHAFAETARDALALLVGADFGTDWRRWESAVADLLSNSQ